MNIDILAFGAHPDDVELSASGTLLKNIQNGCTAGVIDLTRGELGTRGTPALREKEAKEASRVLGLKFRENLKMEDGFFRTDKKNILKVIQKIRQYRPKVVLAPALNDRHPDHGRAAQLIYEACFLSGLPKIVTRISGKGQQPWRPNALYHYIQYRKLKPDFVVDISDYMDKKMESIMAFKSQFYDPNSKEPQTLIASKEFLDYIRQRESEYGKALGVQYAEGFNVLPEYAGRILI